MEDANGYDNDGGEGANGNENNDDDDDDDEDEDDDRNRALYLETIGLKPQRRNKILKSAKILFKKAPGFELKTSALRYFFIF